MKKSNSHVSLLNDLQSGHMTTTNCHVVALLLADPCSSSQFVMWFYSKEDIFSKLAPAAISTVFELQSSAIHHRKGFFIVVQNKYRKHRVCYWKFWVIPKASFGKIPKTRMRERLPSAAFLLTNSPGWTLKTLKKEILDDNPRIQL